MANDDTNLKAIIFSGEKSACTEYSDGSDKKDLCANTKMKNKEFKDTCLDRMRTCLQNQMRAYKNNQAKLKKD